MSLDFPRRGMARYYAIGVRATGLRMGFEAVLKKIFGGIFRTAAFKYYYNIQGAVFYVRRGYYPYQVSSLFRFQLSVSVSEI